MKDFLYKWRGLFYLVIVILPLVLFLLFAVYNPSIALLESDVTFISSKSVVMTVDSPVADKKDIEISVNITNLSEHDCYYDLDASLEIKKNGTWYSIPAITSWHGGSFGISPNSKNTFTIPLKKWFGNLDAGHYRLIKELYGLGEGQYAIAEFDIK